MVPKNGEKGEKKMMKNKWMNHGGGGMVDNQFNSPPSVVKREERRLDIKLSTFNILKEWNTLVLIL